MRKSFLFAIICFLTLSLCGCTAINYFVCENEDGNISYGAIFVFEEDKFKTPADYGEAKDFATEKLVEQGLLVINKAKQLEDENEDENFKINVVTKLNGVDISSFASISESVVTITNPETLEDIKSADEIYYSVVFKTADDYSAFNSESSIAESIPIKEKTFFEIKNGSKRTYDFGLTIESLSYIDEIKTKFSSYLKEGTSDIDYTYIDFSYSYITPHKQIKSNADETKKIGQLYYHTWIVDQSTMTQNVEIYASYPNPVGYYVTSLALSALLTLIFIGLHVYKKINSKHKIRKIEVEKTNN